MPSSQTRSFIVPGCMAKLTPSATCWNDCTGIGAADARAVRLTEIHKPDKRAEIVSRMLASSVRIGSEDM
jgi:hypothetical protein